MTTATVHEFTAAAYVWDARDSATWVFVDLPPVIADEIEGSAGHAARGFGSLRVEARVGSTTWRTSIFPSRTTYVLPLKKAVRRAEGLEVGGPVHVHLQVLEV